MGRKTLLNQEMIKHAAGMIAEGCTDRATQDMLGISHDAWYTWIERGEKEKNTIFAEFNETIKKARSKLQLDCIREIKKASRENWQAAAWILERKWNDDFGKKDKVDMNITPIQIIDDVPFVPITKEQLHGES